MFGPLGFYELVFILGLAFLLLGPRQLSVVSSTLGRTLREFYKATADVRRQINSERAALEEEIRREQKPLQEAVDEIKKIDRTIRQETGSEWSRRNVLGQNEPSPKVKPQALPENRSAPQPRSFSPAPDTASTEEGSEPASVPQAPEIRTPRGATARGSLDESRDTVEDVVESGSPRPRAAADDGPGDSADPSTAGDTPPESTT